MTEASARIIDGTAIAAGITEQVRVAAEDLKAAGITPGLAVVLVGEDPASEVYVRNKGRTAASLGFHSVQHNRPATITEQELLLLVEDLNRVGPDHVAVTGDLTNLSLEPEFDRARSLLDRLALGEARPGQRRREQRARRDPAKNAPPRRAGRFVRSLHIVSLPRMCHSLGRRRCSLNRPPLHHELP